MANYTKHYHLHQWEPEDPFLRTDFNEDLQKIDVAIAGRGDCKIVYGTYIGTGGYGPDSPCVLDFAESLGQAPSLLIVRPSAGVSNQITALKGMKSTYVSPHNTYSNEVIYLTWADTDVSWYLEKNAALQLNDVGKSYFYVAFI